MSDDQSLNQTKAIVAAHDAGRRVGLATAALALGAVSFVNLLGMEKSILAIVLAILAIRGVQPSEVVRTRTWAAIVLSVMQVLITCIALLVFRDELREFLDLLYELY
jgi:uncharacterized membrane protein YadS